MSLFRRPKKAARPRVITINPDEQDEEMDDLPAPSPASTTNNGNSVKVTLSEPKVEKKKEKKQTLLSFDDELEGDDGEVFKVKKSSVSRRLIKQRGKEKKSEPSSLYKSIEKIGKETSEIKLVTEGVSVKKSSAGSDKKSADDKDFNIRILNGREAEAVHMEAEDEDEDEAEDVAVKFRSAARRETASEAVRLALERGQIPDANLIHEARKRRQMAREFSSGGAPEFIPVDNTQRYRKEQSRLVRDDDDNDRSGDEDDDERINFSNATNAARIDRDKRREVFDAAQDEDRDVMSAESDLEIDEWEKQQIRKGVTQTQMQNVVKEVLQQQPYLYSAEGTYVDPSTSLYPSYPVPGSVPEIGPGSKREVKNQGRTMNIDEIVSGNKKMTPEIVLGLLNDR